jgi:hypothetical protein
MAETYEGWANRETWATNLHLANDQGLYNIVNAMADECLEDEQGDEDSATRWLSDYLESMFQDWAGEVIEGSSTNEMAQMLLDIGSLYRVDWREIARHWVADAIERAEYES